MPIGSVSIHNIPFPFPCYNANWLRLHPWYSLSFSIMWCQLAPFPSIIFHVRFQCIMPLQLRFQPWNSVCVSIIMPDALWVLCCLMYPLLPMCCSGLPDPNKPSLPLQPKPTATLGPFTATKSFITATLRPHLGPKYTKKQKIMFVICLLSHQ